MNLHISYVFTTAAERSLAEIQRKDSEWQFGTIFWIQTALYNIPNTFAVMANCAKDCVIELALTIYRTAQWLWYDDGRTDDRLWRHAWNALIAKPIELITAPLQIVHQPMYDELCLLLDANNYASQFQGSLPMLKAVADAERVFYITEQTWQRAAHEQPNALWPTLKTQDGEDEILENFGKEHHLMFNNEPVSPLAISRFVHSLKVPTEGLTEKEHLAFFEECKAVPGAFSLASLKETYASNHNKLIAKVKYCLTKKWLTDNAFSDDAAASLAVRAMAFSTKRIWKAIFAEITNYPIQVSLLQNNLVITPDKKLYLDLNFTNYPPSEGCWTVRDIIQKNMETQAGSVRIDLTSKIDVEPTVTLVFGKEPSTGSTPPVMQEGIFDARMGGSFIPPRDEQPF